MNRIQNWKTINRPTPERQTLRDKLIDEGVLVPGERPADELTPLRLPSTRRVIRLDDRGRAVAAYLGRFVRNSIESTNVWSRDLRKLRGVK